jgi:hypothetical protein
MEHNKQKTNLFNTISEELTAAINWSKSEKHPEVNGLTLFDKIYDNRLDGFTNLSRINEYKNKTNKDTN